MHPELSQLNVSREISPDDTMNVGGAAEWYFTAGEGAFSVVLEALGPRRHRVQRILDLPSGHGRVLRYLRAGWPQAQIVASDIDMAAAQFCAKAFNATVLPSAIDFRTVRFNRSFDLIWVGSLLTHFGEKAWDAFLEFACRHLARDGTLVCSTHGHCAVQLAREHHPVFGLTEEQFHTLLSQYDATGFGYVDYSVDYPTYGFSLASPDWVIAKLKALPGVDAVMYKERAWGYQDVFAIRRHTLMERVWERLGRHTATPVVPVAG